jgi:tRNA-splicing endonuclease subunit Sen15, fungi type
MPTKHVEQPAPQPSSLTKLIDSASASGNPLAATTIQILHNLQYQHLWTSLQTHEVPAPSSSQNDNLPTLISGIPPNRVYTHPDEQLYMLEKGLRDEDLKPERVFVIPTAQGQPGSLRRMAAVFDALSEIEVAADQTDSSDEDMDSDKAKKLEEYYERREQASITKEWGAKRALLAMVDKGMGGEGTVVYYIVQEGEVKPRQN